MRRVRLLLVLEGTSFVAAALVHFGVLARGYEHQKAGTAESVIGGVLLAALALTFASAPRTRAIGLAAQAFALLGTLVGLFTIAVGVGPRTAPDLAYHAAILSLLAVGLLVTARRPGASRSVTPAVARATGR
ncbi:hypothetical protein [Anaeromyxobacter sp. SG17]|uniref:hypothetical protein n=1 Tax=Anaeromyxobacter sp. SG17 TaxID=2925405 RepID=UPI001F57C4B5|nr:hypothetical protein [Anaeromyxobacter sp. SG17]